jgi:hypothetical protein
MTGTIALFERIHTRNVIDHGERTRGSKYYARKKETNLLKIKEHHDD